MMEAGKRESQMKGKRGKTTHPVPYVRSGFFTNSCAAMSHASMILGFSGHGSLHFTSLDGTGEGAGKPECGFQVTEVGCCSCVVVLAVVGARVAAQPSPVTHAGWWPTPPPWPHEVQVVVDTQLVGIAVMVLGGSVGKSPAPVVPVARHRVAV